MDLKKKIDYFINKKKSTLLGIGPMSLNCVDATIEISNKNNFPIFLIASRRQIESSRFGGGYVNNWSTQNFSKYVYKNDKKKNIILARDHGGPWQGNSQIEQKLNEKQTIKNALKSFYDDIDSNFKFIHIDTSFRIDGKSVSKKKSFELFKYFFEKCLSYANKKKKKIYFEIGTEEQSGSTQTFEEIEENLSKIVLFCKKKKFNQPIFTVIQCGTKVMEMRNVGSFEQPIRIKEEIPVEIQLIKAIEICKKYNFYLKEHNTDYLTNKSLSWHPKIGIHAANVAPEFGVAETKAFLNFLKINNQKKLVDEFLKISLESKKWKKWVIDEKQCSEYDKSIIAGHYLFSSEEVKNLKKKFLIDTKIKEHEMNLFLKSEIKKSIYRYIKNFRLI